MSGRQGYLLDTNVLSETRKKTPDQGVLSFLAAVDTSALFVSVLTLGELRRGVAMKALSDPLSARNLAAWVDGLEFSFSHQILEIDNAAARVWGELSVDRPRPVIDTLLAASAISRGLTLVTRNAGDVLDTRVTFLNPWQ